MRKIKSKIKKTKEPDVKLSISTILTSMRTGEFFKSTFFLNRLKVAVKAFFSYRG